MVVKYFSYTHLLKKLPYVYGLIFQNRFRLCFSTIKNDNIHASQYAQIITVNIVI